MSVSWIGVGHNEHCFTVDFQVVSLSYEGSNDQSSNICCDSTTLSRG